MTNELTTTQGNNLEAYAQNLQQKLQMAELFLKSGMLPVHLKSAGAVLTAILYGQEIGLTPMQALQDVQVIQGKPTISAAGLQAKVLEAGGSIREIEHTDKICRLEFKRGKEIREFSFAWEEAVLMGLAAKDNWRKMPKDMLYARAVSRGARRMFADVIRGFYSKEEMLDSTANGNANREPEVLPAIKGVKSADEVASQPAMKVYYDPKLLLEHGEDEEAVEAATLALIKRGAVQDSLSMLWVANKNLGPKFSRLIADVPPAREPKPIIKRGPTIEEDEIPDFDSKVEALNI